MWAVILALVWGPIAVCAVAHTRFMIAEVWPGRGARRSVRVGRAE